MVVKHGLLRTEERRLEAAEMRFPRYVAGYTLWNKERSDKVRSQLGMRKLDKRIRERKQKLAGVST